MPTRATPALPGPIALVFLALGSGCAAESESNATLCEPAAPKLSPADDASAHPDAVIPWREGVEWTGQRSVDPISLPLDWEPAQDCQIEAVAVGGSHACARTSQGHVYCWGSNYSQQLGAVASERCTLGAFEFPCSETPLPVAGVHGVVDLALSNTDSCALDREGHVWCWGQSQSLIFGDLARCVSPNGKPVPGNLTCSSAPAMVTGIETGVSLGGWGTQCAAQRDGSVKCWVAHMGALPTSIPEVTDAVQTDFLCARTREGKVQCWWCNDLGQRGDGTLGPAQEVGVASNCQLTTSTVEWSGTAVDIASGYDHACLVDESGAVACWGDARGGALGVAASTLPLCNYEAPCATRPQSMPSVNDAVQVAAGYGFTCVLDAKGFVSCTTARGALERVDLPAPALQIAGRYGDACAVIESGRVFCWQPDGPLELHEVSFCTSGAE